MDKIEIIRTELAKKEYAELVDKQDYPALADTLNAKPLIDNPVPQKKVPKPISTVELWGCITPKEGLEVYRVPGLKPDIDAAAASGNRNSLNILFAIASQFFSSESIAKVQKLFSQTVLDPNYQPKIPSTSIAEFLEIDFVTDSEVQQALQ